MRTTSRRHLSRTVQACLALAVASPAVGRADNDFKIYTAGLYDSSATVGGHVAGDGASNETVSFFNTAGGISGTATRYTSNTTSSSVSGTAGNNAWYFNPATHTTTTIGLTSSAYTVVNAGSTGNPAGLENSTLRAMDNAGDVAGTSTLYLGTATAGTTAWRAVNGSTSAIRLANETNVVYTKGNNTTNGSTGSESSSVVAMNASGVVVGASARYNSGNLTAEGAAAWIYSGGSNATRIGLFGTGYAKTTDSLSQSSSVVGINANGQASGTSVNYSVNPAGATDAWIYDPHGGTTVIGLTGIPASDPNYAISSNYVQSTTTLAPTVGGVAGASSTTGVLGQTAWVYKIQAANSTTASATMVVSLGGTNVPNGGGRGYYYGGTGNSNITYQSSTINGINASGQAIGFQSIYGANATSAVAGNQDALFFDGLSTHVVGLTSSNYTSGSGTILRTNAVTLLNDHGQMAGTTFIYNGGSASIGRDAWTYSAGDAPDANGNYGTPIGLAYSSSASTTPYTNSLTGARNSTVSKINLAGQVVGTSTRYLADGSAGGTDAYLYTPGGTSVQIGTFGDTDHGYSNTNGVTQSSSVSFLNASGVAAGTSLRYTSTGGSNGQDAWLYDPTTSTNYPIVLPNAVNGATGFANETVQALNDKGLLLGSYTKYDPNTNLAVGTFAFGFTETRGAFDLGLDADGFTDAKWQQLSSVFATNPNGDVVGYGTLTSDTLPYASGTNQAVFFLQHYLLGDANLDGSVDLTDLQIVLNHLGMTSSLRSDGNFDGGPTIDLNDLNAVLNNFSASTPSSSSTLMAAEALVSGTAAATPEPASLGVLGLGGVVILRRRRK